MAIKLRTIDEIQSQIEVLFEDAEQADAGDNASINARIRVLQLAAAVVKDAGTDLRLTAIEKALEELKARGQIRRVS
jgi:hypothetical protein